MAGIITVSLGVQNCNNIFHPRHNAQPSNNVDWFSSDITEIGDEDKEMLINVAISFYPILKKRGDLENVYADVVARTETYTVKTVEEKKKIDAIRAAARAGIDISTGMTQMAE